MRSSWRRYRNLPAWCWSRRPYSVWVSPGAGSDDPTQPSNLRLLPLQLPVARKRVPGVIPKPPHPAAQNGHEHTQIPGGLRNTHPTIPDQPHSLLLEFSRKLRSFHNQPPILSKPLSQCPRNRQQASLVAEELGSS